MKNLAPFVSFFASFSPYIMKTKVYISLRRNTKMFKSLFGSKKEVKETKNDYELQMKLLKSLMDNTINETLDFSGLKEVTINEYKLA